MDIQGDKRIRDAKTHLDISLDFLIRVLIQKKSDQEASITKAERTLGKASKIIYDLAWSVDNQDEDSDRSRSRKKREASDSALDTSVTSEEREAETGHRASGADRSIEIVRPAVRECLICGFQVRHLINF